ncbi:MAG: RidA family protein [Ignavibacteria bacterium]|nr:RidA family protein [Ignavibacteria bacterium]
MINEKLAELGITIPDAPTPLAAYVPGQIVGNLLYTSGQVALQQGAIAYKGKVGGNLSEEEGIAAARICAINCLAVAKKLLGDLEKIERIVKLTVFVNCVEGYANEPKIANGASELLVELFGDNGKHTRSAVGVSGLPLDSAVEIEMIALLK